MSVWTDLNKHGIFNDPWLSTPKQTKSITVIVAVLTPYIANTYCVGNNKIEMEFDQVGKGALEREQVFAGKETE